MENQVEIIKQVNDQEVMDSRDVAKMIGKRHTDLIRDIRRYISVLETDAKLRPSDMEMDPKLDSCDIATSAKRWPIMVSVIWRKAYGKKMALLTRR